MKSEMNRYIVYAKLNTDGYIIAVNSSAFLTDTAGWIEIDSGYGDKYGHAQSNYFSKPIRTISGAYRYKLMDYKTIECTADEITQQEELQKNNSPQTQEDRILKLESQNDLLTQCILELSEKVFA